MNPQKYFLIEDIQPVTYVHNKHMYATKNGQLGVYNDFSCKLLWVPAKLRFRSNKR